MSKPWFGPKRLGWGLGPASWQGWLATAVYAGLMIGGLRQINAWFPATDYGSAPPLIAGAVMTLVFLAIVIVTARGKARWRWGDDRADP